VTERRARTLTEGDLEAITGAIQKHDKCNLGLTNDQANTLKRLLNAFDSASALVGKTLLLAVLACLFGIFSSGFWVWLGGGLKNFFSGK
jgi:hypothetical protein